MQRTLVLHFHELWLKGGNRNFFLGKLLLGIRRSLEPLPARARIAHSRVLVDLPEEAVPAAVERLKRVFGIVYFAVTRRVPAEKEAIFAAAREEVLGREFASFAVRARRSDKTFPMRSSEIERELGRELLDGLRAAGHPGARVNLSEPGITCYVEITSTAALVYTAKLPGPGGMPANTAGRLVCLLSGGYDSAVAAYKVMKRGVHLVFAHFHGLPARPGESSAPVARDLVRLLTPYQFTSKLYLVPFEPIQRQIVTAAPERYRILLYRRMMLRIAEKLARREHALGLVTGDSFSQVASQTLHNLNSVDRAAVLPVYRPLIGDDKQEIIHAAQRLGTYPISSEPFQDCCPLYMPRAPELHARPEQLDQAEAALDVQALAAQGLASAELEKYEFRHGEVRTLQPASGAIPAADS
jgi:thiamine biosynthesis protein ThiI